MIWGPSSGRVWTAALRRSWQGGMKTLASYAKHALPIEEVRTGPPTQCELSWCLYLLLWNLVSMLSLKNYLSRLTQIVLTNVSWVLLSRGSYGHQWFLKCLFRTMKLHTCKLRDETWSVGLWRKRFDSKCCPSWNTKHQRRRNLFGTLHFESQRVTS